MADVLTPEQRRRCMSRVKSKDTSTELLLRKAFWAAGLRYRLHYRIPGRPDMVFIGAKLAVFVDGCFWHGCPLHKQTPRTNTEFWAGKIEKNVERDRTVNSELLGMGWRVVRFWQHEVEKDTDGCVDRVKNALLNA